ncbi:MAG: hypothetical protein QXQ39_05370 [Conexivisphaerales archaeon]
MLALLPQLKNVQLNRVRFSRLSSKQDNDVAYNLGAEFKERSNTKNSIDMFYRLAIESYPMAQRAEIEGTVTLEFPSFLQNSVSALSDKLATDIAIELYRMNYETVYLVFESLGIKAPSPYMIKDVFFAGTEKTTG